MCAVATDFSHLHVQVHIQCHVGPQSFWSVHILPVPHAQNAPADLCVKVVDLLKELPLPRKDHLSIRKNIVLPLYEDHRSTERMDPTQKLSQHA